MTTAQMLLFPEEVSALPESRVSVRTARRGTQVLPPTAAPPASAPPTCAAKLSATQLSANSSLLEPVAAGMDRSQPTEANQAIDDQQPLESQPLDPHLRVQQLRSQLARLQGKHTSQDESVLPVYSTGGQVLDQLLPHRGLRPGTTVQWIGQRSSDCAAALALIAAGQVALSSHSGGKPLVVFDLNRSDSFYPPAAIALGLPADRMVIVQRQAHHTAGDMLWAIDQALRCEAVAGVWAEIGTELNDRDARRLQLAAEAGNTVGMLVRPESIRHQPSFADINWFVQTPRSTREFIQSRSLSGARTLQVTLDRCRGGIEGATAMIDILATTADPNQRIVASTRSHHESTLVSDLARRLANPTTAKRSEVRSQPAAQQRVG